MELHVTDLLDLSHTMAAEYLRDFSYPWEALDGIKACAASKKSLAQLEKEISKRAGQKGFYLEKDREEKETPLFLPYFL